MVIWTIAGKGQIPGEGFKIESKVKRDERKPL